MAYEKWQDVKPQEGKQSLAFDMIGKVDFMLWGGARFGGKSELLSMIPCCFTNDRYYRGIFFRRQYDEIMGANGLWEKAQNMYPLFKGSPKLSDKSWTFPSGAKQFYRHMYEENDKESHRGKGYSVIGFDEIDQFSKSQVTFLMTCLRSEANMDSFCVGTLNPNPDSWCLPLVEYYLDENGLPDSNKCGDIRWFIVKDGDFIFGPSEEWFQENYPDSLWVKIPNTEETVYIRPKKFTYLFFNIFDNPIGLRTNPVYLSELNNLPDHERDTQLWGNWYSRPRSQSMWQRQWVRGEDGSRVRKYSDIPDGIHWYRGVDKGYSIKSDVNRYPDPTVMSPKIGKDSSGMFWIVGDYNPQCFDDLYRDKKSEQRVLGKFCKLAGERDVFLLKQMEFDGEDTSIVLSKDLGAGITDHTYTKSIIISKGIHVVEDKSPKNTPGKKLKDFLPFANACETGMCYIIEESFNKVTLEDFYKELENFEPTKKSSAHYHDDMPDACSLAFSAAASRTELPKFSIPTNTTSTRKSTVFSDAAPIFGKF